MSDEYEATELFLPVMDAGEAAEAMHLAKVVIPAMRPPSQDRCTALLALAVAHVKAYGCPREHLLELVAFQFDMTHEHQRVAMAKGQELPTTARVVGMPGAEVLLTPRIKL